MCCGLCDTCPGPGANECTACIDGNKLWKGACVSPCDADEFRDSDGDGHVDATVSLPGIFQSIFDEAERADFETIVAAAVATELAPSVGVTAAITETTKDTAPTGLTLAVTFTANQASYEDFERAVNDAVTSGGMLAALKEGGKAYQYVQEITISTNVLYTGSMARRAMPNATVTSVDRHERSACAVRVLPITSGSTVHALTLAPGAALSRQQRRPSLVQTKRVRVR